MDFEAKINYCLMDAVDNKKLEHDPAFDPNSGEICMNSMDADGEKAGLDLELNRRLASELPVPIIASGGAGTMQDFKDVFDTGVDAALAASVFHFGQIDIPDLKVYLQEQGIPMRGAEV